MASASPTNPDSSAVHRWSYDVFLSFMAEDTGNTFTGYLYSNLRHKGVNTFIHDRDLVREEEITPSVLKAIEESRIVLVVFSQNYASSTWCLDELAKAVQCSESKNGQTLIPIFYHVDPSDVRWQKGAFGAALQEHEIKFGDSSGKAQNWRKALSTVANLSGRHLSNGHEPDFVETIAQEVCTRIFRPRYIPKNLVGIESHLDKLKSLLNLESQGVRIVGIYGIGGVGKTTIAEVLYNSVAEAFEHRSFLSNIRETSKQYNGLIQLQEKLLSDILRKNTRKLGSVSEGIELIRYKLQNKKVLIVLDDVDNSNQLEALAGSQDWFGSESRIIVTTRDRHLLVVLGAESAYELKELNDKDALELLSSTAFETPFPRKDFEEVSSNVIHYAKGLPLALVILGKCLHGRNMIEWKDKIDSLKKFPCPEIYKVLKVSYDGLRDTEKAIFLDIACFLNGKNKGYAMEVLNSCHLHPDLGVLVDKSLLSIESETLQMHDLLQQMGREIVCKESPSLGKRSRLWFHEDILHVLEEDTGTDAIEGILLDLPSSKKIWLSGKAFAKMKRLRVLIVNNLHISGEPNYLPNELRWLEWSGYPALSLPPEFHPRNLVALKLSFGKISELQFGRLERCSSLATVELTRCESLHEIPDVSTIPNLQKLIIRQCRNLVVVHESVGLLDRLVCLQFIKCSGLKQIPSRLRLKSLEELWLNGCSKLDKFPDELECMERAKVVNLSWTAIKKLPSTIKNLTRLKILHLGFCANLKSLPSSIYNLHNLEVLTLKGCSRLHDFPAERQNENRPRRSMLRKRRLLLLSNSEPNTAEASGEGFSPMLNKLDARNCGLSTVHFLGASNFFWKLVYLNISENNFSTLPACISKFADMKSLIMDNCKQLREILELPPQLTYVSAKGCESLEKLETINLFLAEADFTNCHKLDPNQAVNKLLDEALLGDCRFQMILPGGDIPNWFYYQSTEHSMKFKVHSRMRDRLVGLGSCTVFCSEDRALTVQRFALSINGEVMESLQREFYELEDDHLWMAYFPFMQQVKEKIQDGWNIFEVSLDFTGKMELIKCGVHLSYKTEEHDMNDSTAIQFLCPGNSSVFQEEPNGMKIYSSKDIQSAGGPHDKECDDSKTDQKLPPVLESNGTLVGHFAPGKRPLSGNKIHCCRRHRRLGIGAQIGLGLRLKRFMFKMRKTRTAKKEKN